MKAIVEVFEIGHDAWRSVYRERVVARNAYAIARRADRIADAFGKGFGWRTYYVGPRGDRHPSSVRWRRSG